MDPLRSGADDGDRSIPPRPDDGSPLSTRFFVFAAALFGVWIVLSGKFDAFHLGAGALGSLVIAYFQHSRVQQSRVQHSRDGGPVFPVLRFLVFLPWFLVEVVLSNLRVARLVLGPTDATAPRIVVLDAASLGDTARAFLGCAITLTPGTLTVDFHGDEIWVHALDDGSARDLASGHLLAKVRWVFGASPS